MRRYIEIQGAVRRNPKHPDYSGLGHGTSSKVDESGAIRTGGYHEWLSEQQRIEGRQQKYAREYREEVAAERKRQNTGAGTGNFSGAGGKKWKKVKKNLVVTPPSDDYCKVLLLLWPQPNPTGHGATIRGSQGACELLRVLCPQVSSVRRVLSCPGLRF